jgi:[ribosomal protein S5]-alanine N-acetyltransferase
MRRSRRGCAACRRRSADVGPRVTIAPLARADGAEFIAAAAASRRLHAGWVAPPLTLAEYAAKLQRLQAPAHHGFAIRRGDTGALVGCAEITNIVRGVFLSAYLSYYVFAGHERQGLMTQGVKLVARHAFGPLGLHRLEANIQPANTASIALARACGFAREGFSPRYLKIGGRWRDHERWALLAR